MTTVTPEEVLPPSIPEALPASIPEAVVPHALRAFREPDWWVQVLGLAQLPFELGAFLATWPMLAGLVRGDGHPVLVMPGFGGGDSSTLPLRTNLRFWGYDVHGAGEEVNTGPTQELLDKLDGLLIDLHEQTGRRVSLVGWSIAGRCARYLTRLHPEMVRQVITMASPLQFRRGTDRGSISFIVDPIQHTFAEGFAVRADHVEGPLPVPSSSIYSRTDGVVRWPGCLDVVDERHENVEVWASHGGVAVNPSVHYVIADRLALPEDDWRPFQPPAWLRSVFPLPADWHPRS